MYKGHMEKDKEGGGLNVGSGAWIGESNGGKMGTTVIEQQFKKAKKIEKVKKH